MTAQFLIEMPAEGAARLLTLSLLEQLSQRSSASNADPAALNDQAVSTTYRSSLRRLRGCMALYADALGDSVPGKSRRVLRTLGESAERLHRTYVQLNWCGRFLPGVGEREAVESLGDGPRAAAWMHDRLGRRRDRAARAFQRAQVDAQPLRRLAKRLGVYTTAVRLDTMTAQRSFATMTGDQLIATADRLRESTRALRSAGDHAALRRALRAAEQLGYLLEPIRAYADVEALSAEAAGLRGDLERLEGASIVGRAIIRAGRRVGALHAEDVLRDAMWSSQLVPTGGADHGRPHATPARLQRGLIVLAQILHDEAVRSFDDAGAVWLSGGIDRLVGGIGELAMRLRQS